MAEDERCRMGGISTIVAMITPGVAMRVARGRQQQANIPGDCQAVVVICPFRPTAFIAACPESSSAWAAATSAAAHSGMSFLNSSCIPRGLGPSMLPRNFSNMPVTTWCCEAQAAAPMAETSGPPSDGLRSLQVRNESITLLASAGIKLVSFSAATCERKPCQWSVACSFRAAIARCMASIDPVRSVPPPGGQKALAWRALCGAAWLSLSWGCPWRRRCRRPWPSLPADTATEEVEAVVA